MKQMLNWKRTKTKQALLVNGARQVGKTYLIKQFAQEQYGNVAEINFIENPTALEAFSTFKNTESLFIRISAFVDKPLVPGETLIFIDEVQECKEIVTAVKYLVDAYGDQYDFVLSGSLLGVELQSIRSFPVGYLSIIEMRPLSLEEFAWANGVAPAVIEHARDRLVKGVPVEDFAHQRLLDVFHLYLLVGGMPNAVQTYVDTHDLQAVRSRQSEIVDLYRYDISKYAGSEARAVRRIFDLVPAELNSQSKRFKIGHIAKSARYDRYDNNFMWLCDAGVVLPTCNIEEPRYPVELAVDSSFFKLFLVDVGLLTCLCGMDVLRDMLAGRNDINYGSIYENFVAEELAYCGLCSPAPNFHLYFFRSKKMGELDFVIEQGGQVVPIEVKSGKGYKRHSALNNVLSSDLFGIEKAYVLHEGNYEASDKVLYLPVYATMYLNEGLGFPK